MSEFEGRVAVQQMSSWVFCGCVVVPSTASSCRSSTTNVDAYNSTTTVPKNNIHTRSCAISCKSCGVFPPFGVSNTPWWYGENATEYGLVPIWMGVTVIQDFKD